MLFVLGIATSAVPQLYFINTYNPHILVSTLLSECCELPRIQPTAGGKTLKNIKDLLTVVNVGFVIASNWQLFSH